MTRALPEPGPGELLTQWSLQPLAVVAVVALAAWYAMSVRRLARAGRRWPAGHSLGFALGLALMLWTTCGFPQAYASSLYWIWTAQTMVLLLAVSLVLLGGRPVHLARARTGTGGRVARFLRSRPGRVLANPLFGPALIPFLSAGLVFGPLSGWAISVPPVGWLLQLALVAAGGLVLLPLVGVDDEHSSLRVGLSLAIGSLELTMNAVPGIILRLNTGIATPYFDQRTAQWWAPAPLPDQQTAGAVLSVFAGLIAVPFVLVVFRRWLHADARDAASVDAVLEAERIVRASLGRAGAHDPERPEMDAPWWLNDPELRHRMRRTN